MRVYVPSPVSMFQFDCRPFRCVAVHKLPACFPHGSGMVPHGSKATSRQRICRVYIYIYMCVCVCVRVFSVRDGSLLQLYYSGVLVVLQSCNTCIVTAIQLHDMSTVMCLYCSCIILALRLHSGAVIAVLQLNYSERDALRIVFHKDIRVFYLALILWIFGKAVLPAWSRMVFIS